MQTSIAVGIRWGHDLGLSSYSREISTAVVSAHSRPTAQARLQQVAADAASINTPPVNGADEIFQRKQLGVLSNGPVSDRALARA